jgi:hypothetical protein
MVGALLCLLGCVWIYYGEGATYQSRDVYFVAILLGENKHEKLNNSPFIINFLTLTFLLFY